MAAFAAVAPFQPVFRNEFSHPPWHAVAVEVLVGLSFVLVGAIACLRRPDNRTGALMMAVGFAWFIPDIFWLDEDLPLNISSFFEFFYAVILAHLFMAFPTGRLGSRYQRLLAGGLYVWWVATSLVGLLFFDPRRIACSGCDSTSLPSTGLGPKRALRIDSPPGRGTRIVAEIPVPDSERSTGHES